MEQKKKWGKKLEAFLCAVSSSLFFYYSTIKEWWETWTMRVLSLFCSIPCLFYIIFLRQRAFKLCCWLTHDEICLIYEKNDKKVSFCERCKFHHSDVVLDIHSHPQRFSCDDKKGWKLFFLITVDICEIESHIKFIEVLKCYFVPFSSSNFHTNPKIEFFFWLLLLSRRWMGSFDDFLWKILPSLDWLRK